MNSNYRYQLERYRGRGTRYTCPQCGWKYTFTRYIDTENNNQYLSERVGKCNRLDKCGYHYTPKQYFTDNPHKRDNALVVDGSLRPFTDNPHKRDNALVVDGLLRPFTDNPCKRREDFSFFLFHRENERKKNTPPPRPICTIPEWSGKRLKIEKVLLKQMNSTYILLCFLSMGVDY